MIRHGMLVGLLCFSVLGGKTAQAQVTADEMIGTPVPSRPEVDLRAEDPTQGEYEQAIGFYSNGSLLDGLEFPLEGTGFVKIFRLRDRGWGTFDLIEVVSRAAAAVAGYYPLGERLQIGDVSDRDGGTLSRHASHQNGLDADIAYLNRAHREQNPDEWGERGYEESYVRQGRVTSNFDLVRNWEFVKALVSTGRIGRIFVDGAIKKAMCAHARSLGEFDQVTEELRRLRPYPNHADHFHVRITCPVNSPRCISQEEPPPGPGC